MPDLSTIEIAAPALLVWAAAAILAMLATAMLFWRRHGRGVTLFALVVRSAAAIAVVFALAGFVELRDETSRHEPRGVWRLLLDDSAPRATATDFRESPSAFANRVRNAMAEEHPPQRAEIWGAREPAVNVRDAVLALGMPCTAHWRRENYEQPPRILGIDAPRALQPNEAARLHARVHAAGANLQLLLDGTELPHANGVGELRIEKPGRHVLEAVLRDAQGTELQRGGQVVRVGEPPVLLLLGLSDEQAARAVQLLPAWKIERTDAKSLDSSRFSNPDKPVAVTLTTVDALYKLGEPQAHVLSAWVGRGGGLYVTGDGAKFVAPEYLPRDVRLLLPVTLLKEGKQPEPEDPPAKERKEKVEIAKVSIIFVLDHSASMKALVNNRADLNRWLVAVEGVTQSLKYIDGGTDRPSESYNTRVGVLAFTLKPLWISKPRVFLPFDRAQIEKDLKRLPDDNEFDETQYNTDVYAATRDALDVMKEERSAVKVIVVLTDGADRPKNSSEGRLLGKLREEATAETINIVAIGIGNGFTAGPDAAAARMTIDELATKPGFAYMPGDGEQAEKAHVLFVEQVQTAFATYDENKKKEEDERKRKLDEQRKKDLEPPKVDVLSGEFALSLLPPGTELFGEDALPQPAPKAGWYARSVARSEAAVAMKLDAEGDPPALAFQAYGLGRVAFWAVGGDPRSVGGIAGWADFPALFAGSLRWLLPREEPDVRLLGEAVPEGIQLLDPLPNATYHLRSTSGDIDLALIDGTLGAPQGLPLGPAEIIERIGDEERWIGDVYVAARPDSAGLIEPLDDNAAPATLQARGPATRKRRIDWPLGALWLCTLFLLLMPIERLLRRRS